MNRKKTLLIVALVFVLLIAGASVLYARLSGTVEADRLAVQESQPVSEAPSAPPQESDPPREEPSAGPQAPDFTVYDGEGKAVRLSDFFGKPIVLNFWASWCGLCQMEMPDFHAKYLELDGAVTFLMINITTGRETPESARAFVEKSGYTFPVFYDTEADAAMTYGAYSLPTTFFIDVNGCAIAKATGAIDSATLQRGIDMIMP